VKKKVEKKRHISSTQRCKLNLP